MENVTIVVGSQWGDEGKGKWIDILCEGADITARFQGGTNAGHTLFVDGKKCVLHQIPSGIFHKNILCAITSGVVVDPVRLTEEIQHVQKMGVELSAEHLPWVNSLVPSNPKRLWLSARSHVISPWHIHLDGFHESTTSIPIGTTKRGIGPAYADKASRIGMTLGTFVDDEQRKEWLTHQRRSNKYFDCLWHDQQDLWAAFESAASDIKPYVLDADQYLRKLIKSGRRLLLEGAQGTLLDINHGTYPYVTSSSTVSGGACSSLGFSPKSIGKIYGVAKAYVTRVGEGPFPTELKDEAGKKLREIGQEFGATTGRPRRCGWLDAVALRYSAEVNGLDGIILNKMDVLNGFSEIKIAVAYQHPLLGRIDDFPWDSKTLANCEPIYQTLPGWTEALPSSGKCSDLPPNAKKFLEVIESLTNTKISMVGTGVNRTDALFSDISEAKL